MEWEKHTQRALSIHHRISPITPVLYQDGNEWDKIPTQQNVLAEPHTLGPGFPLEAHPEPSPSSRTAPPHINLRAHRESISLLVSFRAVEQVSSPGTACTCNDYKPQHSWDLPRVFPVWKLILELTDSTLKVTAQKSLSPVNWRENEVTQRHLNCG